MSGGTVDGSSKPMFSYVGDVQGHHVRYEVFSESNDPLKIDRQTLTVDDELQVEQVTNAAHEMDVGSSINVSLLPLQDGKSYAELDEKCGWNYHRPKLVWKQNYQTQMTITAPESALPSSLRDTTFRIDVVRTARGNVWFQSAKEGDKTQFVFPKLAFVGSDGRALALNFAVNDEETFQPLVASISVNEECAPHIGMNNPDPFSHRPASLSISTHDVNRGRCEEAQVVDAQAQPVETASPYRPPYDQR